MKIFNYDKINSYNYYFLTYLALGFISTGSFKGLVNFDFNLAFDLFLLLELTFSKQLYLQCGRPRCTVSFGFFNSNILSLSLF